MAERKKYVGGNWKMTQHMDEAVALAEGVAANVGQSDLAEVVVFPAFPYLAAVKEALGDSNVKLGAQDFYFAPNGAFTGEVSLSMLKDLGVDMVLVGHSERRHVIGETDVLINQKVLAALEAGFEVNLAIGEKLEQREAGQTDAINIAQMAYGLAGVTAEQMSKIVIAYEPVWAIGTGMTATPEDAQAAHKAIRGALADWYGQEVADSVRIQYGGSVKPGNAKELFAQADIDGGLIGGASLKADEFQAIIDAAGE